MFDGTGKQDKLIKEELLKELCHLILSSPTKKIPKIGGQLIGCEVYEIKITVGGFKLGEIEKLYRSLIGE